MVLSFSTGQGIIIAAVGSSAFIVFAMPHYHTSQPRNVIGGHIVGVISGLIGGIFLLSPVMGIWDIGYDNWLIVASAVAVGASIFGMVITDTEHPPASGTALGIAVQSGSNDLLLPIIVIIASSILLVAYSQLMKPWLKDLV